MGFKNKNRILVDPRGIGIYSTTIIHKILMTGCVKKKVAASHPKVPKSSNIIIKWNLQVVHKLFTTGPLTLTKALQNGHDL